MTNPLFPTPEPTGNPLLAGTPTMADAWDVNAKLGPQIVDAARDWLARQRAESERMGLWNAQTGLPTAAGVVNAGQQFGNGMLMGSTAPGMAAHQAVIASLVRPKGIVAYHGSPHLFPPTPRNPLGEFDMSKIGTGEGAQAYAYGPYFAGNEGVAKGYRDGLATKSADFTNGLDVARKYVSDRGSPEAALDYLQKWASQKSPRSRIGQPGLDAIEILKSGQPVSPLGHMYEVNLGVEPEHLLDWDKPLSKQSQHVQVGPLVEQNALRVLDSTSFGGTRNAAKDAILALRSGNMTGEGAYHALAMGRSKLGNLPDPAAASDALREAGIPGVRYLDQGSRAAGEGSHNYVMFDTSLINIARRYGIPLSLLSGTTPGLLAPPE